jgi:hypothetical protein
VRLLPVVVVALAAVLLSSHHAFALSSDPTSGTDADVDPDAQIRSLVGGTGGEGGESHLGYDVNDRQLIEVIHGGYDAILQLLFGCDTDMTKDRAGKLEEQALDEVEPGAMRRSEGEAGCAGCMARLLRDDEHWSERCRGRSKGGGKSEWLP